jgi:integrase/recombinase XerD
VPLPTASMDRLRKLKVKSQKDGAPGRLVFPNSRGNPDSEMGGTITRVAKRAKLNCGRCVTEHGNKCATGPIVKTTFSTNSAIPCHGTPAIGESISEPFREWMGHRDIKSTMVYLKGVHPKMRWRR